MNKEQGRKNDEGGVGSGQLADGRGMMREKLTEDR